MNRYASPQAFKEALEALHAYTLPRSRPNSRVKDLPDIALMGRIREIRAGTLQEAIQRTFDHRAVQPVPSALPDPPSAWSVPYARLAGRDGLPWSDLEAVVSAARTFLDPVLSGDPGTWDPETSTWTES